MPSSHVPSRPEKSARRRVRRRPAKLVHPLPTELTERLKDIWPRFAQHMREGLLAASTAVGLEVFTDLMGTEVEALVGAKGKHSSDRSAYRHGSEAGSVTLGGRRLAVRRPRVRSADGEAELPIATYEAASATDLLAEGILARMLAGLSTRNYGAGLEPVGEAIEERAVSTSHAAVQPPLCHGHRGAAIRAPGPPSGRPPLPCVDARRLEHGRAPPRGSPGH